MCGWTEQGSHQLSSSDEPRTLLWGLASLNHLWTCRVDSSGSQEGGFQREVLTPEYVWPMLRGH